MVELYTMQRYLQYKSLQDRGLQHFDSWASTFGETVSAMELAPEGSGYRMKTRFAKFFNLPELIAMFKEVADIQTADMLNLPVPEVEYHNEIAEPTEFQKDMVSELGERAEEVRKRTVDPSVDNMLKITNDGRKLALDQRMINPMLPDDEPSKVSVCANRVYDIWEETKDKKATQLLFCDLSTPKNDGTFSVYNSIRKSCSKKAYPKMRLLLFTMQTQRLKKMNYSRKCEAVMFVCFSALPQKWVPEQMCRNCSMPRTTLTARGVRQTSNSEQGVSSDRATQTKKCISTVM